jgi:SPW repeat
MEVIMTTARRWQDWVNLLLGAWLVVSPWALDYAGDAASAAWNAYAVGLAVAGFAGIAVYMPKAWQEGASIVLGIWLILAPWLLGFNTHFAASLNAVLVGLLVAGLATWAMLRDGDFDKGWHQHRTT